MYQFIRGRVKRVLLELAHGRDRRHRDQLPRDGEADPADWSIAADSEGKLSCSGWFLGDIAREFGTPLYVVNRSRLHRDLKDFREAFLRFYPKVEVAYSYKTNPLPAVLKELDQCGAGAEVISEFELWLAQQLGVPPKRIIMNGPGKSRRSLEMAVEAGIHMINIDGFEEIEALETLASKQGEIQSVAIRVVTSVGWSAQFGFSLADGMARQAFEQIQKCPHLNPRGIHIHLGTGIKNPNAYFQAIEEVLAFGKEIQRDLGIELDLYDLGGGFGVPTVRGFSEWDTRLMLNDYPPTIPRKPACPGLADYARGISERVIRAYPEEEKRPLLVFEPGRAITSRSQMLLLQVLAIKAGPGGKQIAIMDGGKNIAVPTGYEHHEIFAVEKFGRPLAEKPYDIFGPLCHPDDRMMRRKRFPELVPGDVLAVMDAGAYFVPNQRNFSNPRPGAVMLDEGVKELIREPETFEDIVRLDPVCL